MPNLVTGISDGPSKYNHPNNSDNPLMCVVFVFLVLFRLYYPIFEECIRVISPLVYEFLMMLVWLFFYFHFHLERQRHL